MNTDPPSHLMHEHVFDTGNVAAERGTRLVMWITAAMMLVEITAGWWLNSMALLADGWHMSSHAVAIGLSALTYATARKYARDPRFAFGSWKIEILGGFASAVFLLVVAAMMLFGSLERLLTPRPIEYREAVVIATLGLAVNLACALILGHAHHHGHDHEHAHEHEHDHDHDHDHANHPHHDLNLKSAYLHVIADAATSVLAIVALLGGWFLGWSWLDPLMGVIGALLVARWAKGLIVETGKVLLDREMDHPLVARIRATIETGAETGSLRIADLHVWRVGRCAYSCAMTVVARDPALTTEDVRRRLAPLAEIAHSTIELHHGW